MTSALAEQRWARILQAKSGALSLPPGARTWRGLWALYRERFARSHDGLQVIAHLGQSLDGRIAAANGQSRHVTGPEDLAHMHRLRALADAVVVGAGTIAHDDPQLTVRLCGGLSPVRVVIDPLRRLGTNYRIFRDEGVRTIVLTMDGSLTDRRHGNAIVLTVEPAKDDRYDPRSVLEVLARLHLRYLLIEGGGATVARFWQACCLDRLDLCVAPVIIGQGRDALPLPSVHSMEAAERFRPKILPLGDDLLYVLRRPRVPLRSGQEQEVSVPHAQSLGLGLPLQAP